MKYYVNFLLFFIVSSVSWAEEWRIGKTLTVNSAEIDVTFQVFPDYDEKEKLVHGWEGEDLRYLMIIDQQPGGKKPEKYWKGMLKELKKSADGKKLSVLSEGSFVGGANNEITYKVVKWLDGGEEYVQMLSLIIGQRYAYWAMSTPLSDDIDYMTTQTKALLTSSIVE